jgi:hypothetical protein
LALSVALGMGEHRADHRASAQQSTVPIAPDMAFL